MFTDRRVHGFWALLLVCLAAPASRAAEGLVVAALPMEVAFADRPRRGEAEPFVDLVVARVAAGSRATWVERVAVEKLAAELGRDRLAGRGALALGRGVGADLVVLPTAGREGDRWRLRLEVIDPEKADVLADIAGDLTPGGADAWAARLGGALDRAGDRLERLRAATPVAVLFFANATGTERSDAFAATLGQAIHEAGGPGLRMLRFPGIGGSEGEQRLALAGLTRGAGRWRDVARWWVWGEYREVDWQGKPFDETTIEASVTVWDGEHEPTVVTRRGTVAARDTLAAEVADAVADAIIAAPPAGEPLPASRMARRLLGRALALQRQNIGGEWGVSPAWLARWRHELGLLELARFLDPEQPAPAREFLRARYRDDMATTSGPSSGTTYLAFGEPEPLRLLRRAEAWGDYVERFGLAGEWPVMWPGTGTADNRTTFGTVAGEYAVSAQDVVRAMRLDDLNGDEAQWPDFENLRETWAKEWMRRSIAVLDAPEGDNGPTAEARVRAGWDVVFNTWEDDPARARRIIDRILPQSHKHARVNVRKNRADVLRQIGERTGDPDWATRTLAGLPKSVAPRANDDEPTPRRSVPHIPIPRAPSIPKLPPLLEGISYGERWSVETAALAAHGDAWLAAAGGQDLGKGGFPTATPLFWHAGRPGEAGLRRVDATLGTGGVAGLAERDGIVWIAGRSAGVARFDLGTGDSKRFGPDDGLPTTTLAAVAVDAGGTPTVVSGPRVPPTIATLDRPGGDRWIARPVETFHPAGTNAPTPEVVAVSARTIVVAGDHFGVRPFLSLFDRETQTWANLREKLVAHLRPDFDFRKIKFGLERFNARAVLADPGGGFLIVHDLGVTHVGPGGEMLRTRPFGHDRYFDEFGAALLGDDGRRLWIAGNVHRGGGACLIELDVAGDAPPTFLDVPRSMTKPAALAQQGDVLLVGGQTARPPDVLRFPLFNGSLVR